MKDVLSKAMKHKLGLLIQYYREELYAKTKNIQYSQTEFIKITAHLHFDDLEIGSPVCSRSTFSKLENGKPVHDIELYEFFIAKLNQDFDCHLNLDRQIETYTILIFDAVEIHDLMTLKKLKKEVIELFEPYKNHIYIKEVYQCFLLIVCYILTGDFLEINEMNKFYKVNEIFDGNLRTLLCNCLYRYYYARDKDFKMITKLAQILEKDNLPISASQLGTYYLLSQRFIYTLEFVERAIQHYSYTHNNFRLGECYANKAMVLHNIEKGDAIPNFLKAIEHLNKCEGVLAKLRASGIYYNIGFHYYSQGVNYQLAFDYFMKYVDAAKDVRVFFVFYVLDCMIELGREDIKEVMLSISLYEDPSDEINTLFYPYLGLRLNCDDYDKIEDYVVEEIFPFLIRYKSNTLFDFFCKELIRFVRITRRYSDLKFLSPDYKKIDINS